MLRSNALVLVLMFPLVASGQYTPEELHKHFQNEAEGYDMNGGKFELRQQPLMHWQNPARLQEQGTTYVWEQDGVPKVLVSIFTFEYNDFVSCRHEMLSLANTGFDCELHGQSVWKPQTSGLEWKALAGTLPSESASRRLFQMRTLARGFLGVMHTQHQGDAKLTMLPQPILRYQSPKQQIVDGAIFSFAVATDPEILLVIETKEMSDGKSVFRYAAIRSNYHALELSKDGAKVWEKPLVIALETTRGLQQPWCNNPFYVFTPTEPLPAPGTIQ